MSLSGLILTISILSIAIVAILGLLCKKVYSDPEMKSKRDLAFILLAAMLLVVIFRVVDAANYGSMEKLPLVAACIPAIIATLTALIFNDHLLKDICESLSEYEAQTSEKLRKVCQISIMMGAFLELIIGIIVLAGDSRNAFYGGYAIHVLLCISTGGVLTLTYRAYNKEIEKIQDPDPTKLLRNLAFAGMAVHVVFKVISCFIGFSGYWLKSGSSSALIFIDYLLSEVGPEALIALYLLMEGKNGLSKGLSNLANSKEESLTEKSDKRPLLKSKTKEVKKNELDEVIVEHKPKDYPILEEPILEKSAKPSMKTENEEEVKGEFISTTESNPITTVIEEMKSEPKGEHIEAPKLKPEELMTSKHLIRKILQMVLTNSIVKMVSSSQLKDLAGHLEERQDGKENWVKTHFILMLDCSGSMKGVRWNSLMVGYNDFLKRIKQMSDIVVSTFTFDTKVNLVYKEVSVDQAIERESEIIFTGKGTNYERITQAAIDLINETKYPDHLTCLIFLSDGQAPYPEDQVEEITRMKESGKKIILYTMACVTEEDKDMMKMAVQLGGEHYRIFDPEACRIAFSAILRV